jgi:hypothetical protein
MEIMLVVEIVLKDKKYIVCLNFEFKKTV